MSGQGTSLKLSLLENGLDFIKSGVETFFSKENPGVREHKYALMHIYSGVLLILKERLKLAHPSLIFSDVERMGSADATTVNFKALLVRLSVCAGIKLAKEDDEVLQRAQRMRNSLEHYEVDLNLKHAERLIGELVEFTFAFMRDHLEAQLEKHLDTDIWERVQELRAIGHRLQQEDKKRWQAKAEKYFKLSTRKLNRLRDENQGSPKDDFENKFLDCPQCWEESLVMVEPEVGVCTNLECREVCRLHACMSCGAYTASNDHCASCQDYMRYLMEKD
jgi:hypothetical protein